MHAIVASYAKEYYKSFLKNKNKALVKQPKIITQQPKIKENPNINEHLKTSSKLPKTMRQAEKVFQVNGTDKNSTIPLYSETKKR